MSEPVLAGDTAAADCWTLREIYQQPATLRATQALLIDNRNAIEQFIAPLLADPALRIILTGAGTSAFIGQSLAPCLSQNLNRVIEAIPTTDIVSAPHLHLHRDIPTLLVSLGRSGNSPESLAALDLTDAHIGRAHHLILTCNPAGGLAERSGKRTKVIILPDTTHDRGFAMTSSFTAMMLAALAILSGIDAMTRRIPAIVYAVAEMLERAEPVAALLARRDFDRVVYLGSGIFTGLAREAALKLMELSDGGVVTSYDSPMGFRHGPKTIITDKTLVMVFVSNDGLTGRYDRDILSELIRDGRCGAVVAVSTQPEHEDTIILPNMQDVSDCDLLFPFIVPAQLFSLHVSLALDLNPDRPNRSGTVSRVVQGVQIHQELV